MPWYEYEGLTPGGTAIAGRIEAADVEQAKEDLARMQVDLREVRETTQPHRRSAGLTDDDLIFFNEQLASLAEAGIALDEGLAQLARDIESSRLKRWIEELVADLRRGVPIDEAIARREAGLPLLYSRVVRAGIETGELPATLLNLNQHLQISGNTRRILWEMVSYPLLVLVLGFAIASIFFTTMVPQFIPIYEDFGTDLPAATHWMLVISYQYWTICAVAIGIIVGMTLLWHVLRLSSRGLAIRESIVLKVPAIGRLYRASIIARFLRAVAASVGSGVPLPAALRLGAGATGSTLLLSDSEHLATEVEQGRSIFVANQSTRLIPPLFGFCVQVAAGRDALPVAIGQLAHSYENRALHTQGLLRVVLFPLMIIAVGALLAFGVMAMFLPLVTLINAVSG